MLHGRGGSAADILSLLDHAALPGVAAVAPEAPGNSWWPSSFLAPAAQMQPFVQRGLAEVSAGVARLEQAGLARASIWLCGFSQGACLALEAYAREGAGLAGVFAFSGGLVGLADQGDTDPALSGHTGKQLEYTGQREGQVWLSVHQRDPHIPLKRAEDSAAALRRMGAAVKLQIYPGAGHAVMREDIAALRRHLNG
ncbi:phospholipase [Pseudotabrizicola sediminis]|uniref:Phospholipase n=2 Tax=Pseudotabrizicola sediminis TaxID=2486418 RepID=A0ABY2KKQ3_9RHOB|nr:phospholipase [Pseudotabrizicola sediminis]